MVPRSKIPEIIEQLKAMGAELGLTVATYGHAGDGNLHANILYDGPHAARRRSTRRSSACCELTVELGGTITGEHGVGYAKREFLALEQCRAAARAPAPAQGASSTHQACSIPGKSFRAQAFLT